MIDLRRKNTLERKFSDIIIQLRKEKGFTQQELANRLHITDKAVSKWERGLSYPDITSISSLANVLGVDSSYLIDLCKKEDSMNPYSKKEDIKTLIGIICNAIGVGMGVAVVVLNVLDELSVKDAITMLGIGLFFVSIYQLTNVKEESSKIFVKRK